MLCRTLSRVRIKGTHSFHLHSRQTPSYDNQNGNTSRQISAHPKWQSIPQTKTQSSSSSAITLTMDTYFQSQSLDISSHAMKLPKSQLPEQDRSLLLFKLNKITKVSERSIDKGTKVLTTCLDLMVFNRDIKAENICSMRLQITDQLSNLSKTWNFMEMRKCTLSQQKSLVLLRFCAGRTLLFCLTESTFSPVWVSY
jgi:hypothetical protein